MLRQLLKKWFVLKPPEEDPAESIPLFRIPENEAVLRTLFPGLPTYSYANQIKAYRGRYAIPRDIHGHRDLNDYLWHRAGGDLPPDSRWVIRATAAFAHPDTNIIFATAGPTIHSISIRLPISALAEFPAAAAPEPLPEDRFVWVSTLIDEEQDKRLLKIAFETASTRHQNA